MEIQNNTDDYVEELSVVGKQFPLFGLSCVIYALVYTVCMYKNLCGITSTILVIGTEGFTYFILKKLGYEFKKKHSVYGIIIALLAINLFWTMDWFLLFVDYVAIIMVFIAGVYSVIYDTSAWDFGDSVKAIIGHFFGALSNLFDFGFDWAKYNKEKDKKAGVVSYIVVGIVITIPLMVVVLVLLGGADAVFGHMLETMFDDFDFSDVFAIAFVFAGALLGSYSWISHFINKPIAVYGQDKRTKEPVILIVVGISLGLVYIIFCGVQIVYLFAGLGDLPAGYTYAKYAREGFGQLLVVCLINAVIVLIGIRSFKENVILKVVLTVISACTYFMIFSSAYKMFMYVEKYQMSVLRIWVLWTLVWLAFILTGAVISIYNSKFSLFMYSMVVTSALYIAFAYARPAYVVASYNLSGIYQQDKVDYSYIRRELNPDAASVVLDYYNTIDEKNKAELIDYFSTIGERENNKNTIRNFNVSRYNYYKIVLR